MNIIGRELSFSDGLSELEPTAKRPKMDFLTSSSLWDDIKRRLDDLLAKQRLDMDELTVTVRIALVGARLSLKWKDADALFDEKNLQKINNKFVEHLSVESGDQSEATVKVLCEYLTGCIPLTYCAIDKSTGMDWVAFAALPWLSISCDLDPKWLHVHHNLKELLLRHQGRFANAFVKFPISYFKSWVVDIGCQILALDFFDASQLMIESLSWISRHGKVYREPLINYITKILASGSSELIGELTRNGSAIICSLSGRTNVVNSADEGLSLRCNHFLGEGSCALKLSTVSEDVALFFLEFVFDENEHSVLHRTQLFRSILCHSAHTESLRSAMLKQLRAVTHKSIAHNKVILQRTVLKCFHILIQVCTLFPGQFCTDFPSKNCNIVTFLTFITKKLIETNFFFSNYDLQNQI